MPADTNYYLAYYCAIHFDLLLLFTDDPFVEEQEVDMDSYGHRQPHACPIRLFATFFLPNHSSRDRLAGFTLIEAVAYNYYTTNAELPDNLSQINLDTLLDPWGAPYAYLRINGGPKNVKVNARKDHFLVPVNDDFDVYSMGKDGQTKAPFTTLVAQDDIVRAFNGGYYGKISDM